MHRITLLCVGKISSDWIAEGCRDYLSRLKRDALVDVHEVGASKEKDAERQKKDESLRLLSAMAKHEGDSIVLDETGERMTSAQFAKFLQSVFDAGTPAEFVIGGAYGLTDEVRRGAKKTIRLSDMTFTHEMARLVFLEQLYRSVQITKGTGYHH
ncbi:MAG: 23S rRNA (pseudouridine(1915)-N(3))-methyltransferase RlmH [Candidatus Peribacteraceae bacterium]|nr:23S rRNA (pseudouridine(1915)-N(3))-methyltransferase RlmH [Candidatus Peribacteraceae bacterium]